VSHKEMPLFFAAPTVAMVFENSVNILIQSVIASEKHV